MNERLIICLVIFACSMRALAAAQYRIGSGASVTFEAVGRPSLMKIKGVGARLEGTLELDGTQARGRFELVLDQFDTGIDLRNRHMREKYLETAKFPRALLEVAEVALPKDFAPGMNVEKALFKGTLTLKGVPKPVDGWVSIKGSEMIATAELTFSLSDYPVGVPTYMGVTVADRVSIKAEIPSMVKK